MVHHNPGEPPTKSEFVNPEKLSELGYSGQVLFAHAQGAVTFDSFDKDIFPQGSQERRWVHQKAAEFASAIGKAKEAGMLFMPFTDFIVFPKKLIEKYRKDISCDGDRGGDYYIHGDIKPDIHKPLTQKLVRVQVNEMFDRFPEMDGLMVRVGETYLHDMPYHSGGNPISRGVKSHVTLINILREEVCQKRDKYLVYRTWLSGIDDNPDKYLGVTDSIEAHEKLVFCVKHCIGDFHRTNPFSQVLGMGKHSQLVEVQCQREFEGKGAHPNYIGLGVIEGFEEYSNIMNPQEKQCLRDIVKDPLFAGICTWSRGGGWQGPYIKNEFWCKLNACVMAKWANNTDMQEEEIFVEFAGQHDFRGSNAELLRKIALRSADGVVRGHSSVRGGIGVWWTRDHFIGGETQLKDTFDALVAAGRVEEVLAEKHEAVEIWQEIEGYAAELSHKDKALLKHIRVSCTYGRLKYTVFANAWTVLLLQHAGLAESNRERIEQAIRDYDAAWQQWGRLETVNPDCCATIYKDHYCVFQGKKGMQPAPGIEASIAEYRHAT